MHQAPLRTLLLCAVLLTIPSLAAAQGFDLSLSHFRFPNKVVRPPGSAPDPLPNLPGPVAPIPSGHFDRVYLAIGGGHCTSTNPIVIQGSEELMGYARALLQRIPVTFYIGRDCMDWALKRLVPHPNLTVREASIDRIWIRDFGAHRLMLLDRRAPLLVNTPYFVGRNFATKSDAFPEVQATLERLNTVGLSSPEYDLQGGNFQADDEGNCFLTDLGFPDKRAEYQRLLQWYGCRRVVFLEPLPRDGTRHVDMVFMLAGKRVALIPRFPAPADAWIQVGVDRNAAILRELGYRLIELPLESPQPGPGTALLYFSYINSFVVGRTVFLPQFGHSYDLIAQNTLKSAGYQIVPLPALNLGKMAGSFHCVTNEFPPRLSH